MSTGPKLVLSLRKLVLGSEFTRNVLTLMTGTAIAQVIPIAISPILTRIYTPADLGILALYMAVAGLVATGATGTYEQAILLPQEDEDATNVVALSIIVCFVVSVLMALVVWLFNSLITRILNNPDISVWLYLTPLTVFLTGTYQALSYWLNRRKHYHDLAISRVSQSAASATANLAMGFSGFGAGGLIIGGLMGQIVATGLVGWQSWIKDGKRKWEISREKLTVQAKKYEDFPRYNMPQAFLDGLRESGIILLLSVFFPPSVLGFYAFSIRILRTPLSLIASSIGQVFYQKAAHAYNCGNDLWPLVKEVLLRLVAIAIPVFLFVVTLGPKLFAVVFGDQWREAGRYAQLLSLWILLNFIASPISQIPLILNKQKAFLLIGFGYNTIILATLYLAASLVGNIEIVLGCVSVVAGLYLTGIIIWFIKLSKRG